MRQFKYVVARVTRSAPVFLEIQSFMFAGIEVLCLLC